MLFFVAAACLSACRHAAGKRRKDLVPRATALLTDGEREMTVQLWGDMASEETVHSLREGTVAAAAAATAARGVAEGTARGEETAGQPALFEFTRLRPSFSFSCEALVLNGKSGTIRRLDPGSAEAASVSAAVQAGVGRQEDRADAAEPPPRPEAEAPRFLAEEGGPAAARRFESVAALMSADGFSGAGYLSNVVVRRVDAPGFRSVAPAGVVVAAPGEHGRRDDDGGLLLNHHRGGGGGGGGGGWVPPAIRIYFGDPGDESEPAGRRRRRQARSAGVEAVLRVAVEGGALRDLLGGVPEELFMPASANDDAVDAGRRVVGSLLEGLEVGGQRGERVDAVLACSAPVDANGRAISGGSSYRLIGLRPQYLLPAETDGR